VAYNPARILGLLDSKQSTSFLPAISNYCEKTDEILVDCDGRHNIAMGLWHYASQFPTSQTDHRLARDDKKLVC